ncbi:MAG: hypothetical protein ACRD2Y_00440 [Terriglobales bacterium]
MIDYLAAFAKRDSEACKIAVNMWRDSLMHTGKPRVLHDKPAGKTYTWSMYWGPGLPREQHFTLTGSDRERKLRLGLLYLIEDLKIAFAAFAE